MAYSFASDINITLLNDTSSGNNTEDSKHPQNRHKKFGDIGRTGIVGGAIAGVVVPALVILLGTIYWQCFKDRDDVNIHESGNAELELLPTSNKQPSRKLPQSKNVSTSMFVFCVNQRVRDNDHITLTKNRGNIVTIMKAMLSCTTVTMMILMKFFLR